MHYLIAQRLHQIGKYGAFVRLNEHLDGHAGNDRPTVQFVEFMFCNSKNGIVVILAALLVLRKIGRKGYDLCR